MRARQRKPHLRDFERRKSLAASISTPFGEYLPIHDFGTSLVDAYWRYRSEVVFLQVHAGESAGRPGLYCRWNAWSPSAMNLVASLEAAEVSQEAFERSMERFVRSGVFGKRRPRRVTSRLVRLGSAESKGNSS